MQCPGVQITPGKLSEKRFSVPRATRRSEHTYIYIQRLHPEKQATWVYHFVRLFSHFNTAS